MKLRFTGPEVIVRIVGGVVWSGLNRFVATTPVELAADLLTTPDSEFLIQEATQEEMDELARQIGVEAEALKVFKAAGAVIIPSKPIRKTTKKEISYD